MSKKVKKAISVGITRDDWLGAIADTEADRVEDDPSLVTYSEFSEMMGVAHNTARIRLNALVAAGRAKRTTKRVFAFDGKCRLVTAYKLIPKQK